VYNQATGKVQVRLSRDSANATRLGSDSGVFTPENGETPTPESCLRTVEALPPAPEVVGADTLAGLHHPYNSPQGLSYCIAHGLDIVGVNISSTADDVGWLAEYDNGLVDTARCSIFATQDARNLPSDTIASTYNYAGNPDEPFPGIPDTGLPRHQRTIEQWNKVGGWYGWLAPRYHNWFLPEFLERLGGKAVAMLHCHAPGTTAATEAANANAAIRAVLQYCAQDWTMVAVREIPNATTILNTGMNAALAPSTPGTWGETTLPYPVETVTAAGINWILLPHYYADSVFTTYQSAGLNVLMWGVARHAHRQRVASLGIRGGYALDPVYYRGPQPTFDYRSTTNPWQQRRPALGQLTWATDQRHVAGTNVRGYCQADEPGLVIPPGWGNGFGRPSILCGWQCPLANPTNYTITWDMKGMGELPTTSTTARIGLLFGAATDTDPYAWPQNDPTNNPEALPEGPKTMYRAWQRLDGQIGLGVWESREVPLTTLATRTTPAVAADVWNSYTLTVTPAGITFTRTTSGGTSYSVTSDNTLYRGPYFFIEKEESSLGHPPAPFRAKWRNVIYNTEPQ